MDVGEKSKSRDYCEDLLKSFDLSESEDEETKEEEMRVLPPEAIHMLQSDSRKRSLLDSLNQAQDNGPTQGKNTKWGPILIQEPATRGHGKVNIMEKASAYKRKQNLEIPKTFKGKSFSIVDHYVLCDQVDNIDLFIGGDEENKHSVIDNFVAGEKERCLVFASNNPEIVLPDNLDIDQIELAGTPLGMSFSKPVRTVYALGKTPTVLTKVKPCGLSHPFKIA